MANILSWSKLGCIAISFESLMPAHPFWHYTWTSINKMVNGASRSLPCKLNDLSCWYTAFWYVNWILAFKPPPPSTMIILPSRPIPPNRLEMLCEPLCGVELLSNCPDSFAVKCLVRSGVHGSDEEFGALWCNTSSMDSGPDWDICNINLWLGSHLTSSTS